MKAQIVVGLVGDFDATVPAHEAIPGALAAAGAATGIDVQHEWVPTESIASAARMAAFDALCCAPASPYRNMDGALPAIRVAREGGVAFLRTCGGFQHALTEYARNALGWRGADHAESNPAATRAVVAPLACAQVETSEAVRLMPGSRIIAACGEPQAVEGCRCRQGLNPQFRAALLAGPLQATAFDDLGDVRAIELVDHRFFVATPFQPERAQLRQRRAPLIEAFVRAAATADQAQVADSMRRASA